MYSQALETKDLDDVGTINKPDFVVNPEKYFSERNSGRNLPPLPSTTDRKFLLLPFMVFVLIFWSFLCHSDTFIEYKFKSKSINCQVIDTI